MQIVNAEHALTLYLCERFTEDKSTIFGESWAAYWSCADHFRFLISSAHNE
jgi:hypothetical protein